MHVSITDGAAKVTLDALTALCDLGAGANAMLNIYDGTMPTSAKAALSGNNLLVAMAMSDPAFLAAGDGGNDDAAAAADLIADTPADASGIATFCRVVDKDGVAVMQGDVTATGGGGFLELNSVTLSAGIDVQITALVWRLPEINNT